MKSIIILLSFFTLTNVHTSVHQDTPLELDKQGNICGLPEEFGNAVFNLEKRYLKINDKEIVFPQCIMLYFNIHKNPKLSLSASWYHSKKIMPYYLNFMISQKGKDYTYNVLVNLETLELIDVSFNLKQGNSLYSHEIKIGEHCLEEYQNRVKKC